MPNAASFNTGGVLVHAPDGHRRREHDCIAQRTHEMARPTITELDHWSIELADHTHDANVDPRSLSFKHTVQLWTEWTARGLCSANDRQRLFALIAQRKGGHRPGRSEP